MKTYTRKSRRYRPPPSAPGFHWCRFSETGSWMIAEIKIGRDANLYAQIVGTPRPESFKIRRLGLLLWGPSISAFPDDVTPMEVYRGQAAIQLSA